MTRDKNFLLITCKSDLINLQPNYNDSYATNCKSRKLLTERQFGTDFQYKKLKEQIMLNIAINKENNTFLKIM